MRLAFVYLHHGTHFRAFPPSKYIAVEGIRKSRIVVVLLCNLKLKIQFPCCNAAPTTSLVLKLGLRIYRRGPASSCVCEFLLENLMKWHSRGACGGLLFICTMENQQKRVPSSTRRKEFSSVSSFQIHRRGGNPKISNCGCAPLQIAMKNTISVLQCCPDHKPRS